MTKKSDIRLGQLLVQKKHCSLRQVNEALLEQKHLRTRNENVPVGRLLVDRGVIDEETLREVLAEMGVLALHCPACRVAFPAATYQRGSRPACPQCGGELALNDRPVDAEAPASSLPPETVPAPATPAEAPAAVPPPSVRAPGSQKAPPANDDSFAGRVLGGCQILGKIASGGMGVVYKAKQLNLGRIVAVKVLSRELASDATFVRRFVQEARSAAQLNHGNIVHINDVGECQGVFFFVMEFIDGQNLKDLLRDTPKLDLRRVLDVTTQVCHALRHAHSRGIIHRDIKPENIMLTQEGVVKLADLGLAKRMASENAAGLTHAGAILGTPFYMAPEQAKDFSKVDRRSDIYSLGVTMYRMLTGRVPFDGRSPIEVMIKALDGKRIPIRDLRDDVPAELEQIVDRMMQKNPDRRYQSVEEILQDLQRASNLIHAVPQG